MQLYKYNRVVHGTSVHNIWFGKSNPTMPQGKRATLKEGHPTLPLCGRSRVTLQRLRDSFLCLTGGAPKAESILHGIAYWSLTF